MDGLLVIRARSYAKALPLLTNCHSFVPTRSTVVHHVPRIRRLTNTHLSIVSQLASLLDLNTLHDLSRTCRQFRANLLQYRTMLKALTMRCQNEFPEVKGNLSNGDNASSAARMYRLKKTERITSGKIGPCARDMVGECRKCSKIVCRVRPSLSHIP